MNADLALSIRPVAEPARAARGLVAAAASDAAVPAVAPVTPNPRLRLDAPLGMVVIEFRDAGGDVANTIPTPRQIAAYRAAVVSDAPVPVGIRDRQTPAPAAEPAPEPAPEAPAPRD